MHTKDTRIYVFRLGESADKDLGGAGFHVKHVADQAHYSGRKINNYAALTRTTVVRGSTTPAPT